MRTRGPAMSNSMIAFSFGGASVRVVVGENGEPLFVGKDVCDVLGYANQNKAMNDHCKGVTIRYPLQTAGGVQQFRVIAEPDVFRLIVRSTLPSAEKFEAWIFEEVLPTIRKTGGYSAKAQAQSNGLPEYRKAKAIDMATKAAERIFDHCKSLSDESKQTLLATLLSRVAGYEVLPLPALEEHYMTAAEVGAHLGISSNMVGRIANKHGLKTEEFGKVFLDKSPHSDKQVESFRYNRRGLDKISAVLADMADMAETH